METKEKQVKGGEKPKEKIFIDNSLNEDSKKEVDLDMGLFGRGHGFLGVPKSWNIPIIWLVALILIGIFIFKKQFILSIVVFGLAIVFSFVERSR